ncbi:esterase family protein [Mycolicibacterium sphagni]|nr:esterase family protein [Mycolicibacterium sphagni]
MGPWQGSLVQVSLTHGPLPLVLQAGTCVVLVLAVGVRSRRWWSVWGPGAVLSGGLLALWAYLLITSEGVAGEPAPPMLWIWLGLTGVAALWLVAGWQTDWWRRGCALLAVPLSALCAAETVNTWVGYVPTVGAAWSDLVSEAMPDQADGAAVRAMQQAGRLPPKGAVVVATINTSNPTFKHRDELVYLPPAWFATTPPPHLPTLMMIGGEFNTPTDWLLAGDAIDTVDRFAAAHAGNAPVLVFVDSGGAFNIDTECVNGPRGNAADHLTKDVVPYMTSHFGVSPDPADWGVVGFSAGGTCALDLTVMHPDLFHTFADIAGDLGPNSGDKSQTIDRLYGGSLNAWESFDPSLVMSRHGRYNGVSGMFIVSGARFDDRNQLVGFNESEHAIATTLCDISRRNDISCAVTAHPGKHDWPFAGGVFATTLPWVAGRVHTPGVAPMALPATSTPTGPTRPRSGH